MRALLDDLPYCTLVILLINLGLFGAQIASGVNLTEPLNIDIIRWGGNVAPLTLSGEWWRLLSSMFLHIGVLHLLFNMFMLWSWGPAIERYFGRANFLLIYLGSGLAASLSSALWHGLHRVPGKQGLFGYTPAHLDLVISAGASGALMGMAAALMAAHWLSELEQNVPEMEDIHTGSLVGMVALNLVFGFVMPGIDNACHLGGAAFGLLLGSALAFSLLQPPARRWAIQLGLPLGLAALAWLSWPAKSQDPELLDLRAQIIELMREADAAPK